MLTNASKRTQSTHHTVKSLLIKNIFKMTSDYFSRNIYINTIFSFF